MERPVAIETCLGELRFRDCIFLDSVRQDERGDLTFSGEINADLTSKGRENRQGKKWIPYTLTFQRVCACFSCELDTYENLVGNGAFAGSDFDVIENSQWLKALPVRKDFPKESCKHYRLFTYDMVYHIIAASYQMEVNL